MVSNEITRIDSAHKEIHDGDAYTVSIVNGSLGDNATLNIAFKTPATTKYIHMIIDWSSKAGGSIEVVEAPTWTQGTGTSLAIFNRNRNSSNTSGIKNNATTTTFLANSKMIKDVTTVLETNALTVDQEHVFGAANKGASNQRGVQEVILLADTNYVIRYTADGATNAGAIKLSWAEYQRELV